MNEVKISFFQIQSARVLSLANFCHISPIASFRVQLLQNGLWSENVGTDVSQNGVNSAQKQSV